MELTIKLVGIALTGGILSILLKQYHASISVVLAMGTTLVIAFLVMDLIWDIIDNLKMIANKSDIDISYMVIILKITGISYVCDYIAAVLKDSGEFAIAKKLEFGGKVLIFSMSLPIILDLYQMILSFI